MPFNGKDLCAAVYERSPEGGMGITVPALSLSNRMALWCSGCCNMVTVLCKMTLCCIVRHGRVEKLAKYMARRQHAFQIQQNPHINAPNPSAVATTEHLHVSS